MALRRMAALLFADDRGTVYDHPILQGGGPLGRRPRSRPAGAPHPPAGGRLPGPAAGRRPVGIDPATGALTVLHEVKVGRRRFVPHAVGATLPPGYTRTFLPGGGPGRPCRWPARRPCSRSGPTPPRRWAAGGRCVVWALRTDRRGHWSPAAHNTPDLPGRVEARLAESANPIYRQLARCALEWRCFTAQNTFYVRDEGAIPSSAACNAACLGCLSRAGRRGMPPSSHERIDRPPTAEEMAEVALHHLRHAAGQVMVSFGQGCEGEPLLRWKAIERGHPAGARRDPPRLAPREHQRLAPRGAGGARPRRPRLGAHLAQQRRRPSSTAPTTGPRGYGLDEVVRSAGRRRRAGAHVALNLLTFPGVTDRAGEVEALCRLVRRARVDQVQTQARWPSIPTSTWRWRAGAGRAGAPIGRPRAWWRRSGRRRPGLVVGNFSRARRERRERR